MLLEVPQNMLQEHRKTEGFRWFTDDKHDLFIWLNKQNEIIRLQFSYDKGSKREQVIEWRRQGNLHHHLIDDGDNFLHYSASPIFTANGNWDPDYAYKKFLNIGKNLETQLYDKIIFILNQNLQE
jgi:hypothetical protein